MIKALDARAKLVPELPIGYFLRATAYDHLRLTNWQRRITIASLRQRAETIPIRNGKPGIV